MKNVSLTVLASHLGIDIESEVQVLGYQIDSRNVGAGDLFFALKGERQDGHLFLEEVRGKGAVSAVVSKGYEGSDFGLELLRVESVEAALHHLARLALSEKPVLIIGITGSVGKTTAKEFTATLLEGKFRVGKSPANYNTKLTLPLAILNRAGDEEILVLEMGMSEPGDLDVLTEIAPPKIAVLTKVALAHAAQFPGGLTEIAVEKAKIFKRAEIAIFNHGLLAFPEALQQISGERLSFSLEDRTADSFLSLHEEKYVLDERGIRSHQFDLPFSESHVLENFLAALTVARALKMKWEEIEPQIEKLRLPKMRFERFEKGGILFINDAYNASPESMRAALENLPEPTDSGKRIAVLGSMKELGSFSEDSHREVGRVALKTVDHLLVLGKEAEGIAESFKEAKKPAEKFSEIEPLVRKLKKIMTPGDVVLVKGSRSMKMEEIFDLL